LARPRDGATACSLQCRNRRRSDLSLVPKFISCPDSTLERVESTIFPSLYALPNYDFDLRASHARTLLPAALASVSFGFELVRVRVRLKQDLRHDSSNIGLT